VTVWTVTSVALFACSGDDDEGGNSNIASLTPNSENVCRQIALVKRSFNDALGALATGNPAAFQEAFADARAGLDSLAASTQRSGGANSADVEALVEDVQELRELVATPNLLSVAPQISAQVQSISADLENLEEESNCN
jgi:hypothetical protein